MTHRRRFQWLQAGLFFALSSMANIAQVSAESEVLISQLVPDDTLGNESSVVFENASGISRIDGGATRGSNLFHSFQEFGVSAGQQVFFVNPIGIERILNRVTGSNRSSIDGLLGVDGTADLYLLNPNGIIFGPDARLDVRGAFTASTADTLEFDDGSVFSATGPQDSSLLTVSAPLGLQLDSPAQGDIDSSGRLEAGESLTLLGNQLSLRGQLSAGADLTLQALDTVTIRDTADEAFTARSGGRLTVQGNEGIDIWTLQHLEQTPFLSGEDLVLISDGEISGDAHFESGGSLQFLTLAGVPGNFVSLYDPIILADGDVVFGDYTGVALKVEATGSIQAGNIRITGSDTTLTADGSGSDEDLLASSRAVILRAGADSVILSNVPRSAGGAAIDVDNVVTQQPAGSITLESIDTSASNILGEAGGPIILVAQGNIAVDGSLNSSEFGTGNGGDITISSGKNITVEGSLKSGGEDITILSSGNLTLGGFVDSVYFDGDGGDITIVSDSNISIADFLSSSGVNGGEINIFSGGNIATAHLSSNSLLFLRGDLGVDGGDINISANGNLSIDSINSSSFEGDGGNIDISVDGNAIVTSLASSGVDAGEVSIFSGGNIFIDGRVDSSGVDGGGIDFWSGGDIIIGDLNARSSGGDGGDVVLYADGNITTNDLLSDASNQLGGNQFGRERGDGGDISLFANGNIEVNGSLRSFSIGRDVGDGGNISLFAGQNIALGDTIDSFSNSNIGGRTGNGGNILLRAADGSIRGKDTVINSVSVSGADEQTGAGGAVNLEASNSISDVEIITISGTDLSGDVELQGLRENFFVSDVQLTTSAALEIPVSFFPGSVTTVIIDVRDIGQSGNITITSPADLTLTNTLIQADASGGQPAGNITITSPGLVTFDDSQINSNARGTGAAGEIRIDAAQIRLGEGDRISAETTSAGNGGTITLNATDSIILGEGVQDSAPIISVEASGTGRPGDININTPNFVLSETARITATATASATNPDGGGSITLSADHMDLAGTVGIFAETQGDAPGGILTLQPYRPDPTLQATNPNLDLNLAPGSVVSASSSGSGTGGSLRLLAPEAIDIRGPGRLIVETTDSGLGGDVTAQAQRLTLSDGATISASTTGLGQAGDITFNIADTFLIDASTVESSTSEGSAGNGGRIEIRVGRAELRNNAQVTVDSDGQGTGGDIVLASDVLTLTDSQINADTLSSDGGSITLNLNNLLLLRNGSRISTTAGTAQAGGNGGNVTIDAPFIIAIPQENSDITANAFSGNGGQVLITADGVFGIEPRPQLTPLSDITASSQLGVTGEINFDVPDNTFLENELSELPDGLVNPETLLSSSCVVRSQETGGTFIVTGSALPEGTDNRVTHYDTGTIRELKEQPLAEPAGIYQTADGRLVMSRECG